VVDDDLISDDDLEAAAHTRLHVLIAKHLAARDWSVSEQEIKERIFIGSLARSSAGDEDARSIREEIARIMHQLRRVTESGDPQDATGAPGEMLLPLSPTETAEVHASVKETKGGLIGTLRALRAS
jgi:hypothetical protein